MGYRLVHPDGTVEFSDQPLPRGEEIELREAPTIQFAPATPSPATQQTTVDGKSASKGGEASGRSVLVVTPQADSTVWFDEAGVVVSVAVMPSLLSGQQIAITLDGRVVATGSGSSFQLAGVERGSHTLSASIIDTGGSVVTSSPTITFYLRQHTAIKQVPPSDTTPPVPPTLPE
jgi:hypothetical protein